MKRLCAIAVLAFMAFAASFAVHSRETFQGSLAAAPAPHPSLYSFSDVYRLTVGGPVASFEVMNTRESTLRVAATQAAAAPELQFSVSAVREPGRWALLLAGLCLAAWVAWRRMDFTL